METVLFEDTFIGHIIGFILKGILLLCIVGFFVIVIRWIIKGFISLFSKNEPDNGDQTFNFTFNFIPDDKKDDTAEKTPDGKDTGEETPEEKA